MNKPYNMPGVTRFHIPVFWARGKVTSSLFRITDYPLLPQGVTARSDLITAATGIDGRQRLQFMAAAHAIGTDVHALTLEFCYWRSAAHLVRRDEKLARAAQKDASVTELEWLHLKEISRAQRDELVDILIEWVPGLRRSRNGKPTHPADVLLDYPSLVHRLLDEYPQIACIVYPARLALNPMAVVQVGTMRADAERIVNRSMLHLEEAVVEL
jgi:hypothetical protein